MKSNILPRVNKCVVYISMYQISVFCVLFLFAVYVVKGIKKFKCIIIMH